MKKLTVVMYHYVREISNSRYPNIKGLELNKFIQQIEFFRDNYNIIRIEDIINSKKGHYNLPDNPLLLTFDDGYLEHFTNVYPILKEFGYQGVFYIPAKVVKEHSLLDVNKIHFILSSVSDIKYLIDELQSDIDLYKLEYELLDFDCYYNCFAIENRFDNKDIIFIKRMLQHVLPEDLRNILSRKYFEKYVGINENIFSKELYMNEIQLREMIRGGMHIGCHGYDHYWWNKLDQASLHREIILSKAFLQSLGCNMSYWTASYPYGSYSSDVVNELEKHGCNLAFTTEVSLVDIDKDSTLLFPRLDTNDFPPQSENYINIS